MDQSPLDKFKYVIMSYHNDIGKKNNWLPFVDNREPVHYLEN